MERTLEKYMVSEGIIKLKDNEIKQIAVIVYNMLKQKKLISDPAAIKEMITTMRQITT